MLRMWSIVLSVESYLKDVITYNLFLAIERTHRIGLAGFDNFTPCCLHISWSTAASAVWEIYYSLSAIFPIQHKQGSALTGLKHFLVWAGVHTWNYLKLTKEPPYNWFNPGLLSDIHWRPRLLLSGSEVLLHLIAIVVMVFISGTT